MSERPTPERLAEIRAYVATVRDAAGDTDYARGFAPEHMIDDTLAALDAVTRERDEANALLAKLGADPFVAAAIRASLGDGAA